jgi:uncharacterized membrane protein
MLWLLCTFAILDGILTYILISTVGFGEVNPVMQWVIKHAGLGVTMCIKIIYSLALLYVLNILLKKSKWNRERVYKIVLILLVVVYFGGLIAQIPYSLIKYGNL